MVLQDGSDFRQKTSKEAPSLRSCRQETIWGRKAEKISTMAVARGPGRPQPSICLRSISWSWSQRREKAAKLQGSGFASFASAGQLGGMHHQNGLSFFSQPPSQLPSAFACTPTNRVGPKSQKLINWHGISKILLP